MIFAHILLWPAASISFFMLPLAIPGWLYAILFLLGSFYAMKARKDNIGHDAHLGGAIVGLLITAAWRPDAVRHHWQIFLLVLGAAVALLVYLWLNPLMLASADSPPFGRARDRRAQLPQYKQQELELDAVLEKVAAQGINSLSDKERELLQDVSGKYQRRAQSKKPQSGLAI